MKEACSRRDSSDEVSSKKTVDPLEEFRDESTWTSLSQEERESLAFLMVAEGERELKNGGSDVETLFTQACKLVPENNAVLQRQAAAYAATPAQPRRWEQAERILERLQLREPHSFEMWALWGVVLANQGAHFREASYFADADAKFKKALSFCTAPTPPANFLWRWGLCWYLSGKQSGEAADVCQAIEKYRQADKQGLAEVAFWNDFGNALVDFGCLAGRQELIFDAIDLYNKALKACPLHQPARLNMACAYQFLYEMTGSEGFFAMANDAFKVVCRGDSPAAGAWHQWAVLLAISGRMKKDPSRLRDSLDKFATAHEFDPKNSALLTRWGEAQMWLGVFLEELSDLKAAEETLIRALKLDPDNAETWYLYGCNQHEVARYFEDEDSELLAIERFHQGLERHRNRPLLWYGLAQASLSLGEMRQSVELMEEALSFFEKAKELGAGSRSQFWNDWGVALMKLTELSDDRRHLAEAVEKFEQAIWHQGGELDVTGVDPEVLYNYGCALDFLGDFAEDERYYERAIHVLSKVVLLDPDFHHANYNLALAWSHLGEMTADVDALRKACDLFQRLSEQDQEDEFVWHDWGLALLDLVQLVMDPAHAEETERLYDEAEQKLLQALSLGHVASCYDLACLHSLRGNTALALHFIQRLEQYNALPDLEEMMQDEWLDALRHTDAFRHYMSHLIAKDKG